MPCDTDWMWGMMGPAMILGVALVLVLLVLGVAAVVWLVTQLRGSAGQPRAGRAREALDGRYAAGDITREEYLRARGDLDQ